MTEKEKDDPENVLAMNEAYCNSRQSEVLMTFSFFGMSLGPYHPICVTSVNT